MGKFSYYDGYVEEQAKDLLDNYMGDIEEELKEDSIEFYSFFDDKVHEWVDNDFIYVDLRDSADIIEGSSYDETDSGLWEGQDPIEAVKTKAFFTYRYDLMEAVEEVFNDSLEELETDLENEISDIEIDLDKLKEKLEGYEEAKEELESLPEAEWDERTQEDIELLENDIQDTEKEIDDLEEFLTERSEMLENVVDSQS